MRTAHPIRVASLAIALAAGCDTVDSSTVSTDEMGLSVDVEVDAEGRARVVAKLTTDNDALLEQTYIRLAPGDRLTASAAGVTREMAEEQVVPLNLTQYAARFEDLAGGDRVEVSLTRDSDQDAPRSLVAVPDPFAIDVGGGFSRRDGLDLAWSSRAEAEEGTLLISGACFESITERFDGNPGRAALPGRDFVDTPGGGVCAATIDLRLTNTAEVDRHYGRGGTMRAHQRRVAELTAEP